jgi:hypothetical protein
MLLNPFIRSNVSPHGSMFLLCQVFLGASTETSADAGLRVNDMIVSINGRRVGGMMESAFEVELEASGVALTLVLSRFKHAESVEDRLREAEKQFQEAVDGAINDQRRLGWVDLIPTSRTVFNHAPATGPAPALAQQNPAPLVSNVSNGQGLVDLVPATLAAASHVEASGPSLQEEQRHPASLRVDAYSRQAAVPGILTKAAVQAPDRGGSAANESHETQMSSGSRRQQSQQSGLAPSNFNANRTSAMNDATNLGSVPAASGEDGMDFDFGAGLCDDYDQAWVGCACGIIHDQGVAVFWLQCDSCKSWYNVSPQCVMFTEEEAKSMPSWVCWGCTPPPRRPSASESVPRELGLSHPSPLGTEEPTLALPANQSTFETACALEHQAVALTNATDELQFAHTSEARAAHPSAISELHCSGHDSRSGRNVKPTVSSGDSTPEQAGVSIGAQKRNRVERPCSRIDPPTVPNSNPPQVSAPGEQVPAEAAAHARSERQSVVNKGPARNRGQPSEMIDDSLFYYKGGWVPVPKCSDDGTQVENDRKPVLSVGDRVMVREHGRADHGTGTIVTTKVDAELGRFYDVKFIVGRHTVRDVHEHFVDLLDPLSRATTGA